MRTIAGASAALVLAAVLTACGGSDTGSDGSGSTSDGSEGSPGGSSSEGSPDDGGGAASPRFPLQFRTVACAVPTSELGRGIAEACGLTETVCETAPGPTPPGRRLSTCEELTQSGTAYRLEPAAISGGVQSAEPVAGDGGGWRVEVELGAQEGDTLAELTGDLARRGGGQVALVLDGEVIIAPEVVSPVEGGRLSIEGGFDEQEASRLAGLLKAGG